MNESFVQYIHANLGIGKGIMRRGDAWSKSALLVLVEGDEDGVLGDVDLRLLPQLSFFSGVEELIGR